LIFTGKMIDAEESLALGIVSQVVEHDDLMPTTLELAKTMAAGPPIAIRLAKRAMYKAQDSTLRDALEYETFAQNICKETEDSKEGVAAFMEKREPRFTGR
jgi:enoyl-CoA hydratase/carnithine racemase